MLTGKGRLFVEYYLGAANGNATEAAWRAGYTAPEKAGYRLRHDPDVRALIDQRLAMLALTANEVLGLLSDQATSTIADFLSFDEAGQPHIDLKYARAQGKLKLIRKLNCTRDGRVEIELYDAQDALVHLGRHLKLFTERVEPAEAGAVVVEYVNDWRG
jgi:hypothetical protein